MKALMKITKIPASGETRKKPTAIPISIAKHGDKIELRKMPISRKKKMLKKESGGDCGCSGGKIKKGVKIKRSMRSYQIGGVLPPSPLKPGPLGIPNLDSLRVNKLRQPGTSDLTPSAPGYRKTLGKPLGLNIPKPPAFEQIPTIAESVAKMIRKRAVNNSIKNKRAQQLNSLATKSTI